MIKPDKLYRVISTQNAFEALELEPVDFISGEHLKVLVDEVINKIRQNKIFGVCFYLGDTEVIIECDNKEKITFELMSE